MECDINSGVSQNSANRLRLRSNDEIIVRATLQSLAFAFNSYNFSTTVGITCISSCWFIFTRPKKSYYGHWKIGMLSHPYFSWWRGYLVPKSSPNNCFSSLTLRFIANKWSGSGTWGQICIQILLSEKQGIHFTAIWLVQYTNEIFNNRFFYSCWN